MDVAIMVVGVMATIVQVIINLAAVIAAGAMALLVAAALAAAHMARGERLPEIGTHHAAEHKDVNSTTQVVDTRGSPDP